MRILAPIAIALLLSSAGSAHQATAQKTEQASTRTSTFKVSGMTCAGCEAAVRLAARRVGGVSAVNVSYAKGIAEVTYDPRKTTPVAIAKAITDNSGFKAEPAPTPPKG
jgi:copper chaperone CopZ